MDWVDRVWVGLGWLVGALAVAAIAWSLLGDWARGKRLARRGEARRRCRCGYDMRAIAGSWVGAVGEVGATCPECGRASTARDLTRSRISWRLAAVGALLFLPAWVASHVPEARRDGWDRLMPDVLYVSIAPMNENDWRARWLRALDATDFREHGPLARRILAARTASAMRREHPDWVVEVFDATNPDDPEWESAPETAIVSCFSQTRRESCRDRQREYLRNLRNLITSVVELEVWPDNGGDGGEIDDFTDRMVVGSTPHIMPRVRRLIAAIQDRAHVPHLSEEDGLIRIRCDAFFPWPDDRPSEEHARCLRNTITSVVLSDAWTDNGGDQGSMWYFDGLLFVQAGSPLRARIAELLRAVDRAANHGEPTRLSSFRFTFPGPDPTSIDEHTAVWPLCEVRDFWSNVGEEAWERWLERHDTEHIDSRDGPWRDNVSKPLIPSAVSLMVLGRFNDFSARCPTSDDAVKVLVLGRCLIATAPEASTLDEIDAAHRDLLADVRAGAFLRPSPTSRGSE